MLIAPQAITTLVITYTMQILSHLLWRKETKIKLYKIYTIHTHEFYFILV